MLNPTPMPFKTMPRSDLCSLLSDYSLLGLEGPDAAAFLQAQTMNDARALAVGQWQWNGWLNAKGRVIALFALLRQAEQSFIAIIIDFPAEELLPRLQRFVFRSKVQLGTIDELVSAATFAGVPTFTGGPGSDHAAGSLASGLALDFGGQLGPRSLWLLPRESATHLAIDSDIDARWRAADLAYGLPHLPPSQREAWTPHMLSLERLNAFSLKKGCYPGQEIVARTHYLGQAKRGLIRVLGAGLEVGAPLKDAQGAVIGTVICRAESNEGLAVIQQERLSDSAWLGSSEVTLLVPVPGLRRPA